MAKYLDSVQFARVWDKIKSLLAGKANVATTLAGYGITDAYTKAEVDAKLVSVMTYKGAVATYAELPTTGNVKGDVWDVTENGHNYAWNGTSWDDLGGLVDLSSYYTKTEIDDKLAKKVDIVDGKDLSTNDFTNAYKTKLDGIEEGAQVNILEGVQLDGTDLTISGKKVNLALADKFDAKVDKVEGKGLSTNDYDDTEKAAVADNTAARHEHANKTVLDGIDAEKVAAWDEAQANVIESVKVDGTALAIEGKAVNIDLATPLAKKVDKVDGKDLSSNDYTDADKAKLVAIEAGAQVNVIETVKLAGTALTVTDKAVDIELYAMTESEVDNIIGA